MTFVLLIVIYNNLDKFLTTLVKLIFFRYHNKFSNFIFNNFRYFNRFNDLTFNKLTYIFILYDSFNY